MSANRFLKFNNVSKVPYNGNTLYNILMKSHSTLNVNNLTCESLSPNSPIALLYGIYTPKNKNLKSTLSSLLSL